jgi:Dethiobiotin synthetase
MRGVFIAGTDTGVGKTLFAAGLAWTLRKRSFNVGVMKPFATAERVSSRKYRSSDVAILAKAANATEGDSELNPVFYEVGASPLMAAEMTGKPPPVIQTVLRSLRNLSRKHEFLIVEGIGGVMVPLTSRYYLL